MKVTVDATVCAGHGLCYATAPEVFQDDEEGYGQAVGDGIVPPEQAAIARRAADSCPERAIRVDDDGP